MDIMIMFDQTGGPEVLRVARIELGKLDDDKVRIRQYAAGVNFIDVYYREGLYPAELPSGIGLEAAGEIIGVGSKVHDVKVGDRVAYFGGPLGAYANVRDIDPQFLVALPDGLPYEGAASSFLRSATAYCWVTKVYPVKKGDTVLVHAAAGGAGLQLVQWAKSMRAKVIGTCGSHEKEKIARAFGCDEVILYKDYDFVDAVMSITNHQGVDAVFDSIGKDTFSASIACLKPLGTMVSFGNATGAVPPVSLLEVNAKKPVYLIRPSVFQFMKTVEERRAVGKAVFDQWLTGKVKPVINETYPLHDAAIAHADLAARKTTGSIVLITSQQVNANAA